MLFFKTISVLQSNWNRSWFFKNFSNEEGKNRFSWKPKEKFIILLKSLTQNWKKLKFLFSFLVTFFFISWVLWGRKLQTYSENITARSNRSGILTLRECQRVATHIYPKISSPILPRKSQSHTFYFKKIYSIEKTLIDFRSCTKILIDQHSGKCY